MVEEVANIKFNNLMAFLRDSSVADALALHRGANASHDSPVIFNQLPACLSEVAQKELVIDIRSSPFIRLGQQLVDCSYTYYSYSFIREEGFYFEVTHIHMLQQWAVVSDVFASRNVFLVR